MEESFSCSDSLESKPAKNKLKHFVNFVDKIDFVGYHALVQLRSEVNEKGNEISEHPFEIRSRLCFLPSYCDLAVNFLKGNFQERKRRRLIVWCIFTGLIDLQYVSLRFLRCSLHVKIKLPDTFHRFVGQNISRQNLNCC